MLKGKRSMFRRKNVDATQGPIISTMIIYCIPLILSTLIQTLFNAVDVVVLGNMADATAVASVGATSSVFHLLVFGFVGISGGLKVLIARYIGARETERVSNTISTSLIFSAVFGVIIIAAGYYLTPVFLDLTNCPADCYDGAVIYLRIYFAATPAVLLYNFGSSVLTAGGDTQRPLYYMLAGGILNVVLNIVLCLILEQKVVAVAIATSASQVLGAILTLVRIHKTYDLGIKNMRFDFHALLSILRFGIPIAITNMLYPLANIQIQSAINSFGSAATAGSSAATNIEGIVSAFTASLGAAAGVFMSQNLGAMKHDRVKKSFYHSLWMAVLTGLVIGGFMYLTGEFWLSLLLGKNSADAVSFGMVRLLFVTLVYFIAAANGVLGHAIQSFGYPVVSSVSSIVCVLVFRMIWMTWVYPLNENFYCLNACFTVSWTLLLLCNIVSFTIIYRRYLKGKYQAI